MCAYSTRLWPVGICPLGKGDLSGSLTRGYAYTHVCTLCRRHLKTKETNNAITLITKPGINCRVLT